MPKGKLVARMRALGAASFACALAAGCSIELPVASDQAHQLAGPDPDLVVHPDPFLKVPDELKSKQLADRMAAATLAAARRGATVAIVYRDRSANDGAGVSVSNGDASLRFKAQISSLAKVWIADELLYRDALWKGRPADPDQPDPNRFALAPGESDLIDKMLEDSDDGAAWQLWTKYGKADIIKKVKERYNLGDDTVLPSDGAWWSTVSSPADITGYYDQLIAKGSPELADDAPDDDKNTAAAWKGASDKILTDLMHYNPITTNSCYDDKKDEKDSCGYDQTFGVPTALSQEPGSAAQNNPALGVKQARMCCVDGNWVHWSTGVVGAKHTGVVVVLAIEKIAPPGSPLNVERYAGTQVENDDSAKHARATLTGALIRAFPDGKLTTQ